MLTSFLSARRRDALIALALGILFGILLQYPLTGFQAITIAQVYGLQNELNIRPIMGVDFIPGSLVYADQSGFLQTVTGPAADCVTVNASYEACDTSSAGGSSSSINFADSEIPVGAINGSNITFMLSHVPNPSVSLHLFRNGARLSSPGDYTLTASTGGLVLRAAPSGTDQLTADYRY